MWALHTVPSVAKYPHGSTWTTPSSHTLAARMDVCVHSLSHTHTHTYAARWAKCQESHLMKRHLHTNSTCFRRERPFYSAGQCLCWLFFVCTFLSSKSNRKNEKQEVRQACRSTVSHNVVNFESTKSGRYLWPQQKTAKGDYIEIKM